MWFPINYNSGFPYFWKSCFTFGAGADGRVVLDVAVCAAAADLGGPEAGVLAVQVHAGLLVVAVVVLGALRVAPACMDANSTDFKNCPKNDPKRILENDIRTYKDPIGYSDSVGENVTVSEMSL